MHQFVIHKSLTDLVHKYMHDGSTTYRSCLTIFVGDYPLLLTTITTTIIIYA